MTSQLDWRTEDEERLYGDELASPGTQPIRRRFPWLLLAGFSLLVLSAVLVYWQLNRQVDNVAAEARQDVLNTHRLVQEAAAAGDRELFHTLLDQRQEHWAATQTDLMDWRLFLDRKLLGLSLLPANSAPLTATEALVSSDLTRAEVIAYHPYQVEMGQSRPETIVLQHTFFYRIDPHSQSWRMMPPHEATFWGSWITEEKGRFIFIYSQRDETVGRRLQPYLAELVADLCADTFLDCPLHTALELRLARDPDVFLALNQGRHQLLGRNVLGQGRGVRHLLDLPSPTLIGAPVDEAGYQALAAVYAYLVAANLLQFYGVDPYSSERANDWFAQWEISAPASPLPTRPLSAERPPPILWPDQEALLICQQHGRSQLVRYRPASEEWFSENLPVSQGSAWMPYMLHTVRDGAVLLSLLAPEEGHSRLYLYSDGEYRLLFDEESFYHLNPYLSTLATPPGAQIYLVKYEEEFALYLLDLDECLAGACDAVPVNQVAIWSPDGGRKLATDVHDPGSRLYLDDGRDRVTIATGTDSWRPPFWVDEATFGYIKGGAASAWAVDQREPPETTLVLVNADAPLSAAERRVYAINFADALAAQSEQVRPRQQALFLAHVLVDPANSNRLFLAVMDSARSSMTSGGYLFVKDLDSGEMELLLEDVSFSGMPLSFSPDGRFLMIMGGEKIQLYELDTGEVLKYPASDGHFAPMAQWSSDGQWLLVTNRDEFILAAPAYNYQRPTRLAGLECSLGVWHESNE